MKKNLKTLLDECWDDIKILEKNRDYFINLATEKNQQFYIDHSITEKEYKEALDYCEFNSSVCDAEIKKLLKKSSRIIAKMGKQDLKFIKYESKKEKKLEEKQQSEKE